MSEIRTQPNTADASGEAQPQPPAPVMISFTINGAKITAPAGSTVLEAARANHISIPTLCDQPQLKPAGACRLCVVEIEGMRGLPTACTTPAADGLAVHTETPAVQKLRREILRLILSEHPYTCLVCGRHERCGEWQTTIRKAAVTTGCENCPKNGQCELQCLVERIGLEDIPYPIHYRGLPVEKSDPFFDRDYNLCILCGRCVRVCQDVRQTGTLAFVQRGPKALVGTAFGESHLDSNCEFCGACVDVCPTGALYDKRTKWEGAPETTAKTICPYCSVGCELDVWIKHGKMIGVRPSVDGKANEGQACTRGRFGLIELVHAEDRLATPLIRRDGRLVPTTWETALARAAEKLSAHKGEAFALLGSPHLTTESAFALQKFAREVMGSHSIDCATALPRHSTTGEMLDRLRTMPRATIASIRDAKSILVIGSNPRLSHPIVALHIRQALRLHNAKLVVLDPRTTELAKRAQIHLRPAPGTDAEILHAIVTCDSSSPADIQAAARTLKENAPAMIIFGSGVTHYPQAPATLRAIERLADSLGGATGMLPLLGASNLDGVCQAGLIASAGDRSYDEIVSGMEAGIVKALYIAGEIPPLPSLSKLDVIILQDVVSNPFLEDFAEVVFPAASFAEVSGTLTNLEGKEQSFLAAIPAYREARPDWWIISQLAQKLGADGFAYQHAGDIREDFLRREQRTVRNESAAEPASLPAENRDGKFELILERNQFAYRNFSLTERIRGMSEVKSDEDKIVIHPQDASALGIGTDEEVRVTSAFGTDTFLALIRPEGSPGIAFASINPLAGSSIFPGRVANEKRMFVRLEKVT
jgi:formate dehydrogenase (NADP+) alpha subunit